MAANSKKEIKHICEICSLSFKDRDFSRHVLRHAGEKAYICDICPVFCLSKYHLKSHYSKKHKIVFLSEAIDTIHICDVCSEKYDSKLDFSKHYVKHLKERPHSCNICKIYFLKFSNLAIHSHIHKTMGFTCEICDDRFEDKTDLMVHLQTHIWTYDAHEASIQAKISMNSCPTNNSRKRRRSIVEKPQGSVSSNDSGSQPEIRLSETDSSCDLYDQNKLAVNNSSIVELKIVNSFEIGSQVPDADCLVSHETFPLHNDSYPQPEIRLSEIDSSCDSYNQNELNFSVANSSIVELKNRNSVEAGLQVPDADCLVSHENFPYSHSNPQSEIRLSETDFSCDSYNQNEFNFSEANSSIVEPNIADSGELELQIYDADLLENSNDLNFFERCERKRHKTSCSGFEKSTALLPAKIKCTHYSHKTTENRSPRRGAEKEAVVKLYKLSEDIIRKHLNDSVTDNGEVLAEGEDTSTFVTDGMLSLNSIKVEPISDGEEDYNILLPVKSEPKDDTYDDAVYLWNPNLPNSGLHVRKLIEIITCFRGIVDGSSRASFESSGYRCSIDKQTILEAFKDIQNLSLHIERLSRVVENTKNDIALSNKNDNGNKSHGLSPIGDSTKGSDSQKMTKVVKKMSDLVNFSGNSQECNCKNLGQVPENAIETVPCVNRQESSQNHIKILEVGRVIQLDKSGSSFMDNEIMHISNEIGKQNALENIDQHRIFENRACENNVPFISEENKIALYSNERSNINPKIEAQFRSNKDVKVHKTKPKIKNVLRMHSPKSILRHSEAVDKKFQLISKKRKNLNQDSTASDVQNGISSEVINKDLSIEEQCTDAIEFLTPNTAGKPVINSHMTVQNGPASQEIHKSFKIQDSTNQCTNPVEFSTSDIAGKDSRMIGMAKLKDTISSNNKNSGKTTFTENTEIPQKKRCKIVKPTRNIFERKRKKCRLLSDDEEQELITQPGEKYAIKSDVNVNKYKRVASDFQETNEPAADVNIQNCTKKHKHKIKNTSNKTGITPNKIKSSSYLEHNSGKRDKIISSNVNRIHVENNEVPKSFDDANGEQKKTSNIRKKSVEKDQKCAEIISKFSRINNEIISSLSVSGYDFDFCLKAMQELDDMAITRRIWKKSLEVMKTIKKCRNFAGSTEIQEKATKVYRKFKKFFFHSSNVKSRNSGDMKFQTE